jgi:hypothetical protein
MPSCIAYQHDFGVLRMASSRVVLGVGAESGRAMAGRAAVAMAERLRTAPVTFPGGHDGFMAGQSDAFASTLREVLAG